MFTTNSLSRYPVLAAFLNADSKPERVKYLPFLRENYTVLDDGVIFTASPLHIAAALGKLAHLNMLLESRYFKNTAIGRALYFAAGNGSLNTLNRLLEFDVIRNQVSDGDNAVLCQAAYNGHLEVVNRLLDFEEVRNQLAADNNNVLYQAIFNGHLEVVNRLLDFEEVQNQLAADNNNALCQAACYGHPEVVNRLLDFEEVRNQVAVDNNHALCQAVYNGHLEVVNRLLAFEAVRNQLAINHNEVLRYAAENGHLSVLNCLLEFDAVKNQLAAQSKEILFDASNNGHLDIVNRLLEFDSVKNQVAADNNKALCWGALKGHLEVVKRLLEFAAVKDQIDAQDNLAFQNALSKKHLDIIKILLPFPKVFAYAEMHEEECVQYTHPYLEEKLKALREQRQLQEIANSRELFDLNDPEEVKLIFYMARNLIRRNDPALLDDLHFLLEIPSLKNLAHRSISSEESNELIRLALIKGNQGAAEILLDIPAIRELCIANDYYLHEVQGSFNLRELAQDRESSMHALSTKEQARLSVAIQHYKPLIKRAGIKHLFEALLEMLAHRYTTNPATINFDGKTLNLPLNWEAFQQLKLPEPLYQDALKAYYQNKDHTALRYLSKPNPWMHPEASYVYINPDNRTERWSSFEDYTSLIIMFWLAAIDESILPTENQTLEGRLDYFINELALIGRAHNWDQSRIRVNAGTTLDNEQQPIWVEYDDLEGDRPSCYSGVKRRLFQSVIGHPLLQMLTLDLIKQALQDFVRNHFTILIMKDKQGALKEAYETYLNELEVTPTLGLANISPKAQSQFITSLEKKYGQQFIQDPSFSKYIQLRFQLKTNKQGEVNDAHILNFAAEIKIEQLLQKNTEKLGQLPSQNIENLSPLGFFNQAKAEEGKASKQENKARVLH